MSQAKPAMHQVIHVPVPEELYSVTDQELAELQEARRYSPREAWWASVGVCVTTLVNAIAMVGTKDWLSSPGFLVNAGFAIASGTWAAVSLFAWRQKAHTVDELGARIRNRPEYRVELQEPLETDVKVTTGSPTAA